MTGDYWPVVVRSANSCIADELVKLITRICLISREGHFHCKFQLFWYSIQMKRNCMNLETMQQQQELFLTNNKMHYKKIYKFKQYNVLKRWTTMTMSQSQTTAGLKQRSPQPETGPGCGGRTSHLESSQNQTNVLKLQAELTLKRITITMTISYKVNLN